MEGGGGEGVIGTPPPIRAIGRILKMAGVTTPNQIGTRIIGILERASQTLRPPLSPSWMVGLHMMVNGGPLWVTWTPISLIIHRRGRGRAKAKAKARGKAKVGEEGATVKMTSRSPPLPTKISSLRGEGLSQQIVRGVKVGASQGATLAKLARPPGWWLTGENGPPGAEIPQEGGYAIFSHFQEYFCNPPR